MNKFNRVVVVLVLLKIILFSIAAVVNKFLNLFEWSKILDKIIGFVGGLNIYITGGALLAVFIISLILLIFEFRRSS